MNRSRSTASTGAARQARPPVLRDRPAREGLESAHRRVVEASRGAGACEGGPTRGAKRRSGEDEDAPALPLQQSPPTLLQARLVPSRTSPKGVRQSTSRRRESREVGRRGSLMRTRRGGSAPWARAAGGAGGAQRCWRVVQVANRGPKSSAQSGGRVGEERRGALAGRA